MVMFSVRGLASFFYNNGVHFGSFLWFRTDETCLSECLGKFSVWLFYMKINGIRRPSSPRCVCLCVWFFFLLVAIGMEWSNESSLQTAQQCSICARGAGWSLHALANLCSFLWLLPWIEALIFCKKKKREQFFTGNRPKSQPLLSVTLWAIRWNVT